MTPERFEEIKRISTGLGNIGLLAGIIAELITEVQRLQAEIHDLAYASGEAADTIFRLENEVERLQAIEALGDGQ